MIITTSTRGQQKFEVLAKEIADQFHAPYIKRKRFAVRELMDKYDVEKLLMVTTDGLKCFLRKEIDNPFFFHPSSSMLRIKRLMRGEDDPFVQTTKLQKGMSFLDCTLGLASDAIIASYMVKASGRVVGIESEPIVATIVQNGLQSWYSDIDELNQSMQQIEVVTANHVHYLKICSDDMFDVIYFDPMFETTTESSTGISPLKGIANYEPLTKEVIEEAKRVAKQRIVMKDSNYSSRFTQLGFKPIERKYASHWFGTIELG